MLRYIVSLIFLLNFSMGAIFNVYVNTGTPVRSLPEKFLSMSLDGYQAQQQNWRGLNFS